MMFLYSLERNARVWYGKEPPNSILTWEDLVNKFVNQFLPPSKTTHLKNEISRFTQRFEETFREAWERFKEMLRACPHHGFTELAQIDTFYNGLNDNDQDSINAAAGRNLLSKTTREALQIVENKSKVRYSRNKSNVSRMNTTSRENASKSDDRIDKLADQISTLVDIFAKKVVTLAPVKAVEESCVTCGGAQAYYNCPNTNSNQPNVCAATSTYNQVTPQNRASNYMAPPSFAPVKNSQNRKYRSHPTSGYPNSETDVLKTLPKPNIPYPLRLNDQKLRKNATNQMEKFFQIFQDLHFDVSFADALLLMLKFASTIKSLLTNKDKLFELAKIQLNENCLVMLLKKLPEKLGDPGKFLIPCDFPGMDEYAQEILGFSNNSSGGNPTSTFEPIFSDSSPSLTPFEGSDFILEEIDAYLKDESILPEIDHADCDPKGDICLIEKLSNDDPFQLPSIDLKQGEVVKAKSSSEEPLELKLKDLPSHLEYTYLEGEDKLPVIIVKDLKVDEKEALLKVIKSHKRAIAWKITDIKGKDYAKTIKKQSKPGNIEPEIERLHHKPDQRTFFFKTQVNKAKIQRNTSSRTYLAISSSLDQIRKKDLEA
nr:reverse transcriptase domain-containing protein [Tanacetum cinerariifolium]